MRGMGYEAWGLREIRAEELKLGSAEGFFEISPIPCTSVFLTATAISTLTLT
ncbi:MAG: hypothetical protein OHK0040_04920 [bacterium]